MESQDTGYILHDWFEWVSFLISQQVTLLILGLDGLSLFIDHKFHDFDLLF